jgi:hypothetical protein
VNDCKEKRVKWTHELYVIVTENYCDIQFFKFKMKLRFHLLVAIVSHVLTRICNKHKCKACIKERYVSVINNYAFTKGSFLRNHT